MKAHEKLGRDISIDELKELHFSWQPGLTTSQRNAIEILIDNIRISPELKADAGKLILQGLYRASLGRKIIKLGADYVNGDLEDLTELVKLSSSVTTTFDDRFETPITTDVNQLLGELASQSNWKFNMPTLNEHLNGMSEEEFMVILARPEAGKTAFLTHIVSAPGGFAEQGAKVHILCNEEPAKRTMLRHMMAYTGMTKAEIEAKPDVANEKFAKIKDNIIMSDDVTMTLSKLDKYCSINKPDILIVDQLDRVSSSGMYESNHEKLAEIYSFFRETLKRHKIFGIGVSQASAEAEGKSVVTFSQAEGSKTAKGACADVVLGIGLINDSSDTRFLHLSKNKISGWHGKVAVKIVPQLSRYAA